MDQIKLAARIFSGADLFAALAAGDALIVRVWRKDDCRRHIRQGFGFVVWRNATQGQRFPRRGELGKRGNKVMIGVHRNFGAIKHRAHRTRQLFHRKPHLFNPQFSGVVAMTAFDNISI